MLACAKNDGAKTADAKESRAGSSSSEDQLLQNGPPPHYGAKPPFLSGISPPPSYDDAMLDNLVRQIFDE